MNTQQMRALSDILTSLNRVTNDGMGHNKPMTIKQTRKAVSKQDYVMTTASGAQPSRFEYGDEDEVQVRESPFPFLKTGKVVMEYGTGEPEDMTVTDIVTITVVEGEWIAEFSKPTPKKRKPRAQKMTVTPAAAEALATSQLRTTRKPMSEATRKAAAEKRAATKAAKEAEQQGS